MSDEQAGVGPVDGSVRPAVYARAEDLAQVKGCNGVSVWCESPAIYDADCRPPLSLVPLFDIDELWRVAARAAEIERSKVQAAVAAARERNAGWFALVMNAAAALEDAANCLRDPDAKRAAEGAAKHYREAANAMWAESVGPNPQIGGA